jgi:hypothetical protein
MGAVDSFPEHWGNILRKINNGSYSDKVDSDGIRIDVNTASGSSPVFQGILKIPFSP